MRGERLVKWKKKDANFGGFFVVMLLALTTNASGQQIGNPTTQQDVTFPRSTYAIRNAHIITVGGADIDKVAVLRIVEDRHQPPPVYLQPVR